MKFKKIFISAACAASLLLGSSISLAYTDTEGHWAEEYINEMTDAGILGQFESSEIQPDRPLNRAECAELISDFLEVFYGYYPGYDINNDRFSDLKNGTRNTKKVRALSRVHYYSTYTSEAENFKQYIISGYPDESFRPYNNVTRAEFAKMIVCALDSISHLSKTDNGFYYSDMHGNGWNHWGYKYLDIALGQNIMNGYYDTLTPEGVRYVEMQADNNITRAEAIKMLSAAKNKPQVPYETRPANYEASYYFDKIVKLDTINELHFGYRITRPAEWKPHFYDFGAGFSFRNLPDNVVLETYAGFNIDNMLDSIPWDESAQGHTVVPINLPNADRAYKIYKTDGYVGVIAYRKNFFYSAYITDGIIGSETYNQALEALDTFQLNSSGYNG